MFGSINAWLDGKKWLIGNIIGVITAAGVAFGSLQDGFQVADLQLWGALVAAVMASFGMAGKLQKLVDATKALK